MRASDGIILVVDAVEGLMLQTERLIKQALLENLTITLLINKVDRLILELKLPPSDAYYKLKHTIEDVNAAIERNATGGSLTFKPQRVSPELGNVAFASTLHGWCFSLGSFARLYADYHNVTFDAQEFAKRLWGNAYYDEEERRFTKKPTAEDQERTFVSFILEPVYKIYSAVLGEDAQQLTRTLRELGVRVKKDELYMDSKPLLRVVLSRFFGSASGLVDVVVQHIPSPVQVSQFPLCEHPHTWGEFFKEIMAFTLLPTLRSHPFSPHRQQNRKSQAYTQGTRTVRRL